MKLKTVLDSLEGLDETLHQFYEKQEDGTYLLALDDRSTKEKINEFRTNNVNLRKQNEEMLARLEQFKGVDPNKIKVAEQMLAQIEDQKERELLEKGSYEEVVNLRTKRMREKYDEEVAARQRVIEERGQEVAGLRRTLAELSLKNQLKDTLNTLGVVPRKSALVDLQSRASATFRVQDDGKMVPERDGSILRGSKGEVLTMAEYIDSLTREAPHLFESVQGGGAGGSGGAGNGKPSTTGGKIQIKKGDSAAMAKYHNEIMRDEVIIVP